MRTNYKKLLLGAVVAVGAIASVVFASASHAAVFTGKDCTSNSIITCGVSSVQDLRNKYNASSELQTLYGHFGWTSAMINNGTIVEGIAYRNGNITVGDKVVVTNAQSVGRNQDSGSGCAGTPFTAGGKTYYIGATSCRYGAYDEYVYVLLDSNGQFIGAINVACGNPAPATPVVVPPKPVYTCDLLAAKQLTRTEYQFTTTTTAKNGASVKSYAYNFGDSTTATSTTATVNHTYAKPGTYTVTVTPSFIVNGSTVTAPANEKCKVTVTVIGQAQACNTTTHKIETVTKGSENTPPYSTDLTQCQTIKVCDTTVTPPVIREIYPNQMKDGYKPVDSPECQPKTPMCTVPGKENLPANSPDCVETVLPHTGIGDIFGGILGLGSITSATWYYIASRRA